MDASEVIQLLKQKLGEFQTDPAIKKFYGGTFRAWAASVDSILDRGLGRAGARWRTGWSSTAGGLPWPKPFVILGAQEEVFKFMFEKRLPEVEGVLT